MLDFYEKIVYNEVSDSKERIPLMDGLTDKFLIKKEEKWREFEKR